MTGRRDGDGPGHFFGIRCIMHGPYADHVLDAADVCANCGCKIKTDRVSATMIQGGKTLDSHYSTDPRRTTRDHVPLNDEPAHCEAVFCECGTESAHARHWDAMDYGQFKSYVKAVIRTLREKDVTITERTLMESAYGGFRQRVLEADAWLPILPRAAVDELLASAVDAAIATAAASTDPSSA